MATSVRVRLERFKGEWMDVVLGVHWL